MTDLSSYFVNNVSPIEASVFNNWGSEVEAVRDAAEAARNAALDAAQAAAESAASGTPGPPGAPGAPGGAIESNAIFNGDLCLARLGSSVSPLVHLSRTFDRFVYGQQGSGSVFRWDADTDTPDGTVPFSSKFTVTAGAAISAGEEKHVRYAIEGYDFLAYKGRDAVLTFWVKSSTPGIYCIALTNSGRNRTYVAEYTIDIADTWQEVTINIPFGDVSGGTWDYTNGQGIGIRWAMTSSSTYHGTANVWNSANVTASSSQTNLGATTGNYIKFAKISMNVGAVPAPFTRRPFDETLRLCSRYMNTFSEAQFRRTPLSSVVTSSVVEIYVPFVSPMRALPNVSITGARGTDWIMRSAGDVTNATGSLVSPAAYGLTSGLLRFESGTYTAGSPMALLLATGASMIVFDSEL